ncbi:MAG TPA: type II toxin-antitoxin system VapC family toxin [Balneolaceae bacterium]|nr:type II toxin-antitoxin system VapC family toxin [Balneolaceae bacterium]
MEHKNYLIDTNAIIDFMASRLPETGMSFLSSVINHQTNISVITQIELLGFNGPKEDMALLEDFVDESIVHFLDKPIVQTCIELRKYNKIRLPDAIIAATAKLKNLDLVTRNTKDFESLEGLEVVNPHKLEL